jgi:outer membrane lipoprotein-sorting protein
MKRFSTVFGIALVCLVAAAGPVAAATPDWIGILKEVDKSTSFENGDFSALITVVSTKPGEDNNVIEARYFRRDKAKLFTILLTKPSVQKGQGYLQDDDSLWFYDPESRKFAFTSLRESFQDSDAQNSDFSTSTLAEDYQVDSGAEGKLGTNDVWVLELSANAVTVPIAKRKLWIRRSDNLVLKEEHYSVSGRLIRTIAIPKYQTVSGRFVPLSMLIVDNLKVGEKTQISFAEVSVSKLPDEVFTKAYLERMSR